MTEQEQEEEQLPTVGYDLSKIKNPPQESFAYQEDAVLFQKEKGDELVMRQDIEQLIITVQNQYSKHQNWEDNSEQQAIVDSLIKELLEEVQNQ